MAHAIRTRAVPAVRVVALTALAAHEVLLALLLEREPDLHQHIRGVGDLAIGVGRRMGLDAEQIDETARAAELHDIGKMAIPDSVLHKPGPLSDEERRLINQHTIIGERILSWAPALRPVARLVRHSHERMDGRGYPDGLRGDEIPLGSRIVAVCDAFDAMISERPYSRPRSVESALAELRRCAGTQFDSEVVAVFCELAREGLLGAQATRASA